MESAARRSRQPRDGADPVPEQHGRLRHHQVGVVDSEDELVARRNQELGGGHHQQSAGRHPGQQGLRADRRDQPTLQTGREDDHQQRGDHGAAWKDELRGLLRELRGDPDGVAGEGGVVDGAGHRCRPARRCRQCRHRSRRAPSRATGGPTVGRVAVAGGTYVVVMVSLWLEWVRRGSAAGPLSVGGPTPLHGQQRSPGVTSGARVSRTARRGRARRHGSGRVGGRRWGRRRSGRRRAGPGLVSGVRHRLWVGPVVAVAEGAETLADRLGGAEEERDPRVLPRRASTTTAPRAGRRGLAWSEVSRESRAPSSR